MLAFVLDQDYFQQLVFQHLFPFVRQKEDELAGAMLPSQQIDGAVQFGSDVRIPPVGKRNRFDRTGIHDALKFTDAAVLLGFGQLGRFLVGYIHRGVETVVGEEFQVSPLCAFDDETVFADMIFVAKSGQLLKDGILVGYRQILDVQPHASFFPLEMLEVVFDVEVEGGIQVVCDIQRVVLLAEDDIHFDVRVQVLLLVQFLQRIAPVQPELFRIIAHTAGSYDDFV